MNKLTKTIKHPVVICITAILCFTGIVSAKNADFGKRGKGGNNRGGVNMMVKQLDLTDEQQALIKELKQDRSETSNNRRSQRQEIQSLIESGDISAASEMAAASARDGVEKMAAKQLALSSILSTEQLTQLSTLQAERHAKRAKRLEKRQSRRNSSDRDNSDNE